jgi:pSer/pThr/pTyr-binding forkhead associated (FHA) protein
MVGPHTASASELKERLDAERRGQPFLILRNGQGTQLLRELPAGTGTMTIGRSPECDIALEWDHQVSRVHAELETVGPGWTVSDGGLSRNGSYLNGERLRDRRLLHDGDTLRFGSTSLIYRQPASAPRQTTTVLARDLPGSTDLSPAQRTVLKSLCRPFAEGESWARPATNREIADELVLSLDAVKGHLRVLFAKFEVDQLPQNEKRLRLAERALNSGAISLTELREDTGRASGGG